MGAGFVADRDNGLHPGAPTSGVVDNRAHVHLGAAELENGWIFGGFGQHLSPGANEPGQVFEVAALADVYFKAPVVYTDIVEVNARACVKQPLFQVSNDLVRASRDRARTVTQPRPGLEWSRPIVWKSWASSTAIP